MDSNLLFTLSSDNPQLMHEQGDHDWRDRKRFPLKWSIENNSIPHASHNSKVRYEHILTGDRKILKYNKNLNYKLKEKPS